MNVTQWHGLGRSENPCTSETVCNISCRAPSDRFIIQRISPNVITFLHSGINCDANQMKHQLDATLCRFYFCRITLHVSGASAHHQEYLKLVQRPLVHVLSLQVSHHISLLGPELNACKEDREYLPYKHSVPALIRRCDDWPATITHAPVAAVLVLNTPDDGHLRPRHVEWPCRNKTCSIASSWCFIWHEQSSWEDKSLVTQMRLKKSSW